ncbi:MAG: YceD family protein [Cellulomonadaceae bacterium]|nr:YceD family protein [Cellulomonadaceae bacterium]
MLDTRDLARTPGAMREFARTVPAPADLGIPEIMAIPEGSDLAVGVRLQSVMEGVLVDGAVRGTAVGECSRCLDPVTEEVTVHIAQLFVYPERAKAARDAGDENAEDSEELPELIDDTADIEPVIRDSVVPALPFRPLCQPDCPGLCSECGARLADDPEHHHDIVDPRWSALQTLLTTTSGDNEVKES